MEYTRTEIAENFELWGEYVDPSGTMTKAEFEKLTLPEKMQIQQECFGDEIIKGTTMTKTVEQKLFDAWKAGRGVRLTAEDVEDLLFDEALCTRISNRAALDAGHVEPGEDCTQFAKTWKELQCVSIQFGHHVQFQTHQTRSNQ